MMTTWCSRFVGALSISAALVACSGGSSGGSSSGTGGSTTGGTGGTDGSTTGTPTTAGTGGQGGGTSSSSSGGSASSTTLKVDGKLAANAGQMVPAAGDLGIAWEVGTPMGSHLYAYGSGQSMGTSFQLSLGQAPPTDALTSGAVGLGIITLFPTGKKVADGVIDKQALKKDLIGATDQYAIFYKVPNYNGPLSSVKWFANLPPGYSCAKRGPATTMEIGDWYTPVDCSEVIITVDTYDNISIFKYL